MSMHNKIHSKTVTETDKEKNSEGLNTPEGSDMGAVT